MADLQQRERAVEKMRHNRRMRRRIYAVLGAVVVLAIKCRRPRRRAVASTRGEGEGNDV